MTEKDNTRQRLLVEYRTSGYAIIDDPTQFPAFLVGCHVDFVAIRDDDKRVVMLIEPEGSNSARVRELANRVANQHEWKLELIPVPREHRDISEQEISVRLNQVRNHLLPANLLVPGLLTAWTAIEALLRALAVRVGSTERAQSSLALVKTLFADGAIGKSDFDTLERAVRLRNELVHGYEPGDLLLSEAIVRQLLDVADGLRNALSLGGQQSTPEHMAHWFLDRYEPATEPQGVANSSLFVRGGPYHAREEISNHFANISTPQFIESAAAIVAKRGKIWVKKGQY